MERKRDLICITTYLSFYVSISISFTQCIFYYDIYYSKKHTPCALRNIRARVYVCVCVSVWGWVIGIKIPTLNLQEYIACRTTS